MRVCGDLGRKNEKLYVATCYYGKGVSGMDLDLGLGDGRTNEYLFFFFLFPLENISYSFPSLCMNCVIGVRVWEVGRGFCILVSIPFDYSFAFCGGLTEGLRVCDEMLLLRIAVGDRVFVVGAVVVGRGRRRTEDMVLWWGLGGGLGGFWFRNSSEGCECKEKVGKVGVNG